VTIPFEADSYLSYQGYFGDTRRANGLATFTFAIAFSAKKQACGPEARALRGKSIGGKRIPSGDPPVLPQGEASLSVAQPGAPTTQLPCPWEKNGLPARPRK